MKPLTERQKQIALLIAEGLPNKEIASRLHISARTLKNMLVIIGDKLALPYGSGRRILLTRYAIREGWIQP